MQQSQTIVKAENYANACKALVDGDRYLSTWEDHLARLGVNPWARLELLVGAALRREVRAVKEGIRNAEKVAP